MPISSHKRPRVQIAATTLVEVLVVIVVFLIGILAVAQIFPGGFKILDRTRDSSIASALVRAEIERLKSRGEELPDRIVPVQYVGGVIVEDPTRVPTDYNPGNATEIAQDGTVLVGGGNQRWQYVSAANAIRRVIGETHRIAVPAFASPDQRVTTAPYGSVTVLQYGPIELSNLGPSSEFIVYGRDMFQKLGAVPTTGLGEFEYFLEGANGSFPVAHVLTSPTSFRISAAIWVLNGGNRERINVTAVAAATPSAIPGVSDLSFQAIFGPALGGGAILSVEASSVQISRVFNQVANTNLFTTSPYEFVLMNPRLGVICVNPAAFNRFEQRPGGSRLPIITKVDYTVRDWRIIREDFRLSADQVPNENTTVGGSFRVTNNVFRTTIPSIKTLSDPGPDNQPEPSLENDGIFQTLIPDVYVASQAPLVDNLAVIDLNTGGIVAETSNGVPSIRVNKNNGEITFTSKPLAFNQTGLLADVVTPGGTVVETDLTNRPLRVIYKAKKQWALQVTKASSRYSATTQGAPASGQFYVGGTNAALLGLNTRIYFPRMDVGQKVSLGRVRYIDAGGTEQYLEGANFVTRFDNLPGDTITAPLPMVDIRDVVPNAVAFSFNGGVPVDDVRGASARIRAFWNPNFFTLGPNTTANLNTGFRGWVQTLNVTTKETFLNKGESIQ